MKLYKIILTLLLTFFTFSQLQAQDDNFESFKHRAWGIGGDDVNSMAKVSFEDTTYTVFAFSQNNIEQTNSSLSGDKTTFLLNIEKNGENKQVKFSISQDYLNSEVVLKVYANSQLVGESFSTQIGSKGTYLSLGTISVE